MKKIMIILLTLLTLFLFACSDVKLDQNNPYIHQYELVEKHLYNKNVKVTIPIDGGNYVSDYEYLGIMLINKLDIDEYVERIIVKNNEQWIKENTNDNTIIIDSNIENEQAYFYVNENGQVITLINDNLYRSDKGLVDYQNFIDCNNDLELGIKNYQADRKMIFRFSIVDKNGYTFGDASDLSSYLKYENGSVVLNDNNVTLFYGNEKKACDDFIDAASYKNKRDLSEGLITEEEYNQERSNLFEKVISEYKNTIYQLKYQDSILKRNVKMISIPKNTRIGERHEKLDIGTLFAEASISINIFYEWNICKINNSCICFTAQTPYYIACDENYLNMDVVETLINYSDEELNTMIEQFRLNLERIWEERF